MATDESSGSKPGSHPLSTGTVVAGPGLEPISGSGPKAAGKIPAGHVPSDLAACSQYADIRELGRGGMGIVYLARNVMMNRPEVLKIVNKSQLDWPGAAERFIREIRSAAKLRHPNVVGAYAAHQLGDLLVLAMEYVEGVDLGKLIKDKGALPVTNACFYAYQAALGLQHAHEKQMVHRDIKPSNLILTREGKRQVVKVLDFGLAKGTGEQGLEDSLSGAGKMVMCTPDYVAPEQIKDSSKADTRSDIYSLGCTLYYMLAGRLPFVGKDIYDVLAAHRNEKAARLTDLRPEVPDGLSALVAKMMAKDPAHRFQTPAEVAAALRPYFRPGVDAEVLASGIVLTPVRIPPPEPGPSGSGPVKSPSKPTRAVADDPTPTVRKRPRPARWKKSTLTTPRMIAQLVGGFLILALFIAWAAGAFKPGHKEAGDGGGKSGQTQK